VPELSGAGNFVDLRQSRNDALECGGLRRRSCLPPHNRWSRARTGKRRLGVDLTRSPNRSDMTGILRAAEGRSRRRADIADRDGVCRSWAESGPSRVAREGQESFTKRASIFALGGRSIERASAAAPCLVAGEPTTSATRIAASFRISVILRAAPPCAIPRPAAVCSPNGFAAI
jgi:hypothetical protein